MRIRSITVRNFRAVREVTLSELTDAVVVAGPNGCGKSSIFDAIRFLKSAYGNYVQNEYAQWFNEFNINVNNPQADTERLLFDPTKPLSIDAEFEISNPEREFLRQNSVEVYRSLKWSLLSRRKAAEGDEAIVNPATKRADGEIVEQQAQELSKALLAALDNATHRAALTMKPGDTPSIAGSPVLELVFSVYRPNDIGVIDYQSPTRVYDREQIGGINLRIQDASQKNAQSALYNTQSKYTGVKTEMAQSYVMEVLAEKAGVQLDKRNTFKATLDELFQNFFPGKKFLGATPTASGALEFPVLLENGRMHDINDLSSGEKEVLLGYLQLRNTAPKYSIILLDEPELHLNPRLARSLPRFYEKYIGRANSSQIWMVTHSDSILREAVQEPAYSVFHMRPAEQVAIGESQVDRVVAGKDVENAVLSLVGDLASYSPRSKVVLLEGENSEVDARIISQLFPDFADRVNLVSLGSKRNVSSAHDALERAAHGGKLDARFFSIVDMDFGGEEFTQKERRFSWDRYHIENYLLEPAFVRQAISEITLCEIGMSEAEVRDRLRKAAELTITDIVRIKMEQKINKSLVGSIDLGFDKGRLTLREGFSQAIERSKGKLENALANISAMKIEEMEEEETAALRAALQDDTWSFKFRGRNVLKQFVDGQNGAIKYEQLRNLVIARMRESSFRPAGMQSVIDQILAA